jgi:hypothetical protein
MRENSVVSGLRHQSLSILGLGHHRDSPIRKMARTWNNLSPNVCSKRRSGQPPTIIIYLAVDSRQWHFDR